MKKTFEQIQVGDKFKVNTGMMKNDKYYVVSKKEGVAIVALLEGTESKIWLRRTKSQIKNINFK